MEPSSSVIRDQAQDFYECLSHSLTNEKTKHMFTELFEKLVGKSIVEFSSVPGDDGSVSVSLILERPQIKVIKGEQLSIPKELRFSIEKTPKGKEYIQFDDNGKDAPYSDLSGLILKSKMTWWQVFVENNDQFRLYRPHWFGLFFYFGGGTPCVSSFNRRDLPLSV